MRRKKIVLKYLVLFIICVGINNLIFIQFLWDTNPPLAAAFYISTGGWIGVEIGSRFGKVFFGQRYHD